MNNLINYRTFEKKKELPIIEFKKKVRKKGAKTDVYDVIKDGMIIGQVKWYSRLRGYGFLPTPDSDSEIKQFIKDLMQKRREEKKALKESKDEEDEEETEEEKEKRIERRKVKISRFGDKRKVKFNSTESSPLPGPMSVGGSNQDVVIGSL